MNLSEIFVKRPVMTTLVMLALLIFGVLGYRMMPVDALPNVDFPTISVSAVLPGASPETMAATVATPLERQFATINGIDSMNSTSALGTTSITIQFDLNRNIDSAAQDVQSAIAAAIPLLPPMPARPAFRKVNSGDMPVLFIAISSDTLPLYKVDEYAETDAAQRISMVDGVAQVQVYGSQKYAVRVSIDPRKIAQMGIGINQIAQAMQKGNVKLPTGTLYGAHTVTNVQSNDQLNDAAAWRQLIVAYNQGSPVRLGQVADVKDSVENDKIANWCDGKRAVVLAILRQPGTNTIKVIDDVKKLLPSLRAQFPASVNLSILYDRSTSIKTSISDVQTTLLITAVLVVTVIFLFLRNARATIIPSLALPMSIIGTFAVISILGFSINVMTLMALTLCTGFVVDDAIVVLENIVRHLDAGEAPFKAALAGSREISFTILSMTLSLVAVFIPVLFFGGIVGRLFKEFAMTIVISVVISGFVSLSLTPMLCSRFLIKHDTENEGGFLRFFDRLQQWMLSFYDYWLKLVIKHKLMTLLISFLIVGITFFLFGVVQKGFIPNEDIGQIFGMSEGAQDVSYEAMVKHQQQVAEVVSKDPNVLTFMSAVGAGGPSATMNSGRVFMMLKPRDQRKLSADQIIQEMKKKLAPIPGIRIFMQNPMAMKLGGQNTKGIYQLTMQGTSLPQLYSGTFALMEKLKTNEKLQDVNTDLLLNSPQAKITINKEKAYSLGISTKQIDDALSLAYGGTQISTIYTPTNEYKVIIEVAPQYYRSPNLLSLLYLRSSSGKLIPLDAIAEIGRSVSALQVNHLGQLASSTISFNLKPDVSLGTVLPDIQKLADATLPSSVTSSFQGTAQAFQSSQQNSLALLVLAIAVIYIVLGILYESFIHPLTILAGLPSAGFGALVTLLLFHAELNIYAWLGLVMLLGIVKKNAIMMVDSALDLQRLQKQKPEEAIYNAALMRFRPIMMTTMAALMGSLPIACGFGAGGDARQPLGLAVVGGLIASQVLTLLITPVVYIYLDKFAGAGRRKKLKLQYN
ncbi:MAG: efflux RND transporter permease subunit [Candidatus Obscuribacterales bacterium]|nr:efflux RND transporter permease subunit [Candidatus Obscuribacterales bacterium]